MAHNGLAFKNQTVELDGHTFLNCQVENCEMSFFRQANG